MGPKDKDQQPIVDDVALVDAVMDHAAQEAADQAEFTPEENDWARRVRQGVDVRLAELRRQLTYKRPPPIPAEIRALDRDGLLARLETLRQRPGVRYAHLDLTGLTTDDLRQLVVAILEPPRES